MFELVLHHFYKLQNTWLSHGLKASRLQSKLAKQKDVEASRSRLFVPAEPWPPSAEVTATVTCNTHMHPGLHRFLPCVVSLLSLRLR
uniref:Uncharacterized protein n=1 Tax=Knipowitschia caucasica TaxID=637954 RepID=A0AAV2M6W0_KNICA